MRERKLIGRETTWDVSEINKIQSGTIILYNAFTEVNSLQSPPAQLPTTSFLLSLNFNLKQIKLTLKYLSLHSLFGLHI